MKLMILDGNSIINRAFYGVRLLSTKDGVYTNAIYGFLNILERLRADERAPVSTFALMRATPSSGSAIHSRQPTLGRSRRRSESGRAFTRRGITLTVPCPSAPVSR